MLMLISSISLMLSMLFVYMKSPLTLAIMIIMQSLIMSILMYKMTLNAWYLYLLIMIFLSAMMIIFIYVCSLASNQLMTMNNVWPLLITFTLLLIIMTNNSNNYIMMDLNTTTYNSHVNQMLTSLYNMYSPNMTPLTIYLIVYLLLALIVVVKMASFSKSSLRMKK